MDGSTGTKGTVVDVIKNEGLTFDNYYTCGPEPMLDALALNYPENGQLSLKLGWDVALVPAWDALAKLKLDHIKESALKDQS